MFSNKKFGVRFLSSVLAALSMSVQTSKLSVSAIQVLNLLDSSSNQEFFVEKFDLDKCKKMIGDLCPIELYYGEGSDLGYYAKKVLNKDFDWWLNLNDQLEKLFNSDELTYVSGPQDDGDDMHRVPRRIRTILRLMELKEDGSNFEEVLDMYKLLVEEFGKSNNGNSRTGPTSEGISYIVLCQRLGYQDVTNIRAFTNLFCDRVDKFNKGIPLEPIVKGIPLGPVVNKETSVGKTASCVGVPFIALTLAAVGCYGCVHKGNRSKSV